MLYTLKNVSKSFYNGKDRFFALKDINIELPSKGLVFIEGKSGCGKSTLLSLLGGISKPEEGLILYKERDLRKESSRGIIRFHRFEVGMVFQHYFLLDDLSAKENVMLPLRLAGKGRIRARLIANELLRKFGINKLASKKVKFLSGGEKQRVAIARALSNDPSVILADEPTGALDQQNSKIIMNYLFSISKEKLVIVVTHNKSFSSAYPSSLIQMEDGQIKNARIDKVEIEFKKERKIHPPSGVFGFKLAINSLFKNWFRNLISLVSTFICLSAILLSVGYFEGSKPALAKMQKRNLGYSTSRIYKTENVSFGDSPLTLVKETRPSKEEIMSFLGEGLNYEIGVDPSFFFPSESLVKIDQEEKGTISFYPVFNISDPSIKKSLLIEGDLPSVNSFSYCLINRKLSEIMSDSLGSIISFDMDFSFTYKGKKKDFKTNYTFTVAGVVDEFEFLSSPAVFYSYCGLLSFLEGYLFNIEEENLTALDLLIEGEGPLGNYGYLLFSFDEETSSHFYNLSQNENSQLKISSFAFNVASSFESLSGAIEAALFLFVGLTLVSSMLIIGMLSYTSFIKRKKEMAILSFLGSSKTTQFSIFCFESLGVVTLSAFLSILLAKTFEKVSNAFFYGSFGVESIIQIPLSSWFGFGNLLPICILFASISMALLSTLLPLLSSGRFNIQKELQDE